LLGSKPFAFKGLAYTIVLDGFITWMNGLYFMALQAQESIRVKDIITVIPVSDLAQAKEWYSKLFGKGPDLEPFPGNVEYKLGNAWVQISKGTVRPSNWNLQIEVHDLAREHRRLQDHGIITSKIGTSAGVITWFDVKDPDANGMRWFQVLTEDSKVTAKSTSA